jgi:hypothetical protein
MSHLPQESSNNSVNIHNWKEYLANECSYDLIRHDNLINYSRSLCREQLYCVMCGRSNGANCVIPNQNKDVCKTCDSLIWKVLKLNVVVKFCKGIIQYLFWSSSSPLFPSSSLLSTNLLLRVQKLFFIEFLW